MLPVMARRFVYEIIHYALLIVSGGVTCTCGMMSYCMILLPIKGGLPVSDRHFPEMFVFNGH